MQPADLRDRHDATLAWRGDGARDRRIFVQRQVRARLFVICAVEIHDPLESGRAQHDDAIETLASRGADEPFDIRVLAVRSRRSFNR